MKVRALDESALPALRPLIMNYGFKPYMEYGILEDRLVNYILDEVEHYLSSNKSICLTAEEDGEPAGFISASKLEWDSRHFGIEMARIKHLVANGDYSESFATKSALLSAVLKEAPQRNIQHFTACIHTQDTSSLHALEKNGFQVMDSRLTYAIDLHKKRFIKHRNQYPIREFRNGDLKHLGQIALESFTLGRLATDRFHADPSLSSKKSDELYVEWIINSCRGSADIVLVAEIDGTPVGYITCELSEDLTQKLGRRFGFVIINAVSPSARGKGVYASLFNSALGWLAERIDIVEVGTQIGNYVVQKVWTKFGLSLNRSEYLLSHSKFVNQTNTGKKGIY